MPGPWRPPMPGMRAVVTIGFNLNRDARPLATGLLFFPYGFFYGFQSQPRCQAPGDEYKGFVTVAFAVFQSQPRCQAPGDLPYLTLLYHRDNVSISTEMPGPWRQYSVIRLRMMAYLFQSQPRCQAPGDMGHLRGDLLILGSFNLNRDARPLATS